MAGYVLRAVQRWLGKKRRGKRFQRFCRDALVGNPGDPLIGFPIIVYRREFQTENRELLLSTIVSPRRTPLLAHRGQSLRIRCHSFLHCDSITEGDNPPRDGRDALPWQ
jgi:hypothetical protein